MTQAVDYLRAAFAALRPDQRAALLVALVFASVWVLRKIAPVKWESWANLVGATGEDATWFETTVRQLWQGLPALVLGAAYGALLNGGDFKATLRDALLGALAPITHHLLKRYEGGVGKVKIPTPRVMMLMLTLTVLALVACTPSQLGREIQDPCGKVSLTTILAGCRVRKSECKQGDASCPVYRECKAAVAAWRTCPVSGGGQ